jgi:hypothetical protein
MATTNGTRTRTRKSASRTQPIAETPQCKAAAGEPKFEAHRYPPRFFSYYGTSRQLVEAGVLSDSFRFPDARERDGWAHMEWESGPIRQVLVKRHTSSAEKRAGRYSDYWWLRVFDTRHELSDNLVEIWRNECGSKHA